MNRMPMATWHKASYDRFLHDGLPGLLGDRLGLRGYRVESGPPSTCRLHLEGGAGKAAFAIVYDIPIPDAEGVFTIEGIKAQGYPSVWIPDLVTQRFSGPHELVVLPVADRDDLDEAIVSCVGEQLLDYISTRLGQLPEDVDLDANLVRTLAPLETWIRAFLTQTSQQLNGNNWLDRASHLRRLFIPDRKVVFTPGHFGRTCPFESPEGPNVGRILTISRGADIRDGRLVILDESPEAGLGLTAACLPFLEHDDGNRVLMGVNMMRQWVPPADREPALVQTGQEPEGVDFWGGRNLLTAFLSWDTGAFEDAIVLSQTAARKLACPETLEPGDKLSNRHGLKGVVSRILPDDEMPRLPDGSPLELLYSICGIPSRWVVGALREAAVSHVAKLEGAPIQVAPFHAPSDSELRQQLEAAGLPADGMLQLTCDGAALPRRTTAGWVYWGCTVHLAREKMFGATTLDDRPQQIGPMEIQALREAGAHLLISEFTNTCSVARADAAMLAERVTAGPLEAAPAPAPRFDALARRLRSAGIDMELRADGVRFGITAPEDGLPLTEGVPHPWSDEQRVERVHLDDTPLADEVREANGRLADLLKGDTPTPILAESRQRLQRSIEALFASQLPREALDFESDVLFSARSILIPGDDLALHQLGVPEDLLWKLFGPQTEREMGDPAPVEARTPEASAALDRVLASTWVILHRAPTTGRTSLLAFQPVRRPGRAIQVHPLASRLLDADFDGDQAALYVPLTAAAITEARDCLSIAAHIRDEPTLIGELAPVMDAAFGLATLSRTETGRQQITDIVGTEHAPAGDLWNRGRIAETLRSILAADGVDGALQAAQQLMEAGFAAARAEGASIGPFIGHTLSLPTVPETDAFDHWQAWQEEVHGLVDAFRDYDDEDAGVVHLLSHSGARANTHQVAALFAPGGPVHDARGHLVPVRRCWREGLSASEALVRVVGARRGLFRIREQIAALEEDHALRSRPVGYGVLARARRCQQPGIVFARAAATGEVDPLEEDSSRLFVGLPMR